MGEIMLGNIRFLGRNKSRGSFINNNKDGIRIHASNSNILYDNNMTNCGFVLEGESSLDWESHTIATNNSINGKAICYLTNKNGGKVPTNAGWVFLYKCSNILVENININNSSFGIQLLFSNDNIIKNNICNNNYWDGLNLYCSHGNLIVNNRFKRNEKDGICLISCKKNLFYNNILDSNKEYGMNFHGSVRNKILNNFLINHKIGLELSSSWESMRSSDHQTISRDDYYFERDSYENIVANNSIYNNQYGIIIYSSSSHNKFFQNMILNNKIHKNNHLIF